MSTHHALVVKQLALARARLQVRAPARPRQPRVSLVVDRCSRGIRLLEVVLPKVLREGLGTSHSAKARSWPCIFLPFCVSSFATAVRGADRALSGAAYRTCELVLVARGVAATVGAGVLVGAGAGSLTGSSACVSTSNSSGTSHAETMTAGSMIDEGLLPRDWERRAELWREGL